ncbi:MAG: Na+/H+ antiporter NhaC family protein [Planctomycetota bacterium]|nr:MAG: Na+/H+ antiporter NhaC family protein [Planctomycetota bacterium]REJ89399.1 MAG: Na+/H+ antiporter NhaC family protein [Planctomycetota bacterium]
MESYYGAWSLVPPLLAVGLAILTRRVVLSLLLAVVSGCAILAFVGQEVGILPTLFRFLWNALPGNFDRLLVMSFSLFMGAMIGVVHKSGGMRGLVELLQPLAKDRRRGQLTGWLLGMIIFFDDYANTLLIGQTMRSVTDRLRISREKLAYIVDSTAAPIAGVSLLSTWVATEINLIDENYRLAYTATDFDSVTVFLLTVPTRFYPIWAFLFVMLVAASRRDFGPMLEAERRAVGGDVGSADAAIEASPALTPAAGTKGRWYLAVVPIVVMIGVVVGTITLWGSDSIYYALLYGSGSGYFTALVMVLPTQLVNLRDAAAASLSGARVMLLALSILWLAWALSDLTKKPIDTELKQEPATARLATAEYISAQMDRVDVPAGWMPTAIFLLAAVISFCTGTSWGTMYILMPLAIQVTHQVLGGANGSVSPHDPIMLASVGSVLGGSIFGDHCSPLSDTTILSSRSSGCHHMAHVYTQLPYALLVGLVSIVFGTLPAAYGVSAWLLLPVGLIVLWLALRLLGRDAESPSS